jgi:hypothetical protein
MVSDQKAFIENSHNIEPKSAGNKRIPLIVPAKSINPLKVPQMNIEVAEVAEVKEFSKNE